MLEWIKWLWRNRDGRIEIRFIPAPVATREADLPWNAPKKEGEDGRE